MHVPPIIFILLHFIVTLTWCGFYILIVSHVTVVKKTPNKVKRITAKAISHLYSCKYSSPITYLSVYAVNPCRSPVKLQNPN